MISIKKFLNRQKDEEIDEEYENKLKKHKLNKFKRYAIIVAVFAIFIIGIRIYYINKTYSSYSVTNNILSGDTTKCKFYEYGDYFIRYSNDGLAYIKNGETVWNQAFEMKQPILDICNDYVAIAEQQSNTIYIFDTTGLLGKIKTAYPIVNLEVAGQGVVAAITTESNANHIELMDKDGEVLVSGQTVLSGDGCPIDISLSEDGTKLMVSYLYVNGGASQTKVVFYNYSEVGKNEVDRVVGGFNQYKSTIVPKVEFLTNDIAVAFGDDMFTIYSIKQKPSIIAEYELDKEIKSIFYSEEYIGFTFQPENLDDPYDITIYDIDGDIIYEGTLDLEYKNIKLDNSNLIIYSDDTFIVQTVKGKIKFSKKLDENINEILGINGGYKYILVSSESIDQIKLK
jgi:hypothetical protein